MTVQIRDASLQDFANFKLHHKNIEEVQVLSGIDADTCLAFLLDNATEKNICLVDNKPTCLFGFLPNNEVWLFFSEDVTSLPISFFKESRKYIASKKEVHGTIYYKNTFALDWAKFMRFEINPTKDDRFYRFHKWKEV